MKTRKTRNDLVHIWQDANEGGQSESARQTENEGDLGKREADLAKREANLAKREAALVVTTNPKRWQGVAGTTRRMNISRFDARSGSKPVVKKSVTKKAVLVDARGAKVSRKSPDGTGNPPPHKVKK